MSMFTEEDGTAVNNEDRKKLKKGKMLKFTQFCNSWRALGKISVFENCSSGIWGWRFYKNMCIIACILLYLHSEVTQRFKRSYFIITSRMVKRKARKCHQNKLQGLLEVWVFLCTTFKIKTIHIFLRWTNLKNCLLVYWHESFYYDNNQGLL